MTYITTPVWLHADTDSNARTALLETYLRARWPHPSTCDSELVELFLGLQHEKPGRHRSRMDG